MRPSGPLALECFIRLPREASRRTPAPQEITPVAQRGALLAIGTAVGTSAGLLAPYVMGSVVEAAASPLDGFNIGLMICGVIMLVGGVIGMMLMRPERETMRWASKMPEVAVGPG